MLKTILNKKLNSDEQSRIQLVKVVMSDMIIQYMNMKLIMTRHFRF
jgi:hypothetical protein